MTIFDRFNIGVVAAGAGLCGVAIALSPDVAAGPLTTGGYGCVQGTADQAGGASAQLSKVAAQIGEAVRTLHADSAQAERAFSATAEHLTTSVDAHAAVARALAEQAEVNIDAQRGLRAAVGALQTTMRDELGTLNATLSKVLVSHHDDNGHRLHPTDGESQTVDVLRQILIELRLTTNEMVRVGSVLEEMAEQQPRTAAARSWMSRLLTRE